MAKLSAHGQEIGRTFSLTSAKAYMADGVVLKNDGFGWKLAGKVKAGITPKDAYTRQLAKLEQQKIDAPAYTAYKNALHKICGLSKRGKLHTVIAMMPEDADGVWSTVCDDSFYNIHADVWEINELCKLYLAALAEHKTRNSVFN